MISQALLAARALSSASSDNLDSVCADKGQQPGIACRLTWDILHNRNAAELVKVWLAQPASAVLRIIFVLLIAVLVRIVAHRLINKITSRVAQGGGNGKSDAVLLGERRRQRAKALGSILRNAASVLIFGIAAVTIAGDLGLNLAPVLASAGVLGLAIGFGAQSLVRDFLSGIFMLLEDQYGVESLTRATPPGPSRRSASGSPGCATSTAWSGTCATGPSTGSATSHRGGPAPWSTSP